MGPAAARSLAALEGQPSGTPNHELAEERLREQLLSGEVHESLVADPLEQAA